jgi:hypothetical protein
MIRKSMPSGHDPMGGHRFSLATNAERVCAEIILKQKDRADDDSKKSHPALWRFRAKACPGLDPGWIPVRVKKIRQNKD